MASAFRRQIRRIPWAVAKRCLPMPLLYRLWSRKSARHRRTDLPTAADVRSFDAGPGVRIEAYWSDVPGVGLGPSASVHVQGEEVLRVDVFGGDRAHMHINPGQIGLQAGTTRFHFPPDGLDRQIERGVFEIEKNTPAAVAHNMLRQVHRSPIDRAALARAAADVRAHWLSLAARHGADAGPAPATGPGGASGTVAAASAD